MLTVIIISYNSFDTIERCLARVLDENKFRFLIVDNASPDGSAEKLKARFPLNEVIALNYNMGYGRAANVALRQVTTPYALLLNPDLIATTEDVEQLLDAAEHDGQNTALWGPAISEIPVTEKPVEYVDRINGCALLFDCTKFQHIGFFDENIFLFFEETDLCYRIIEAGMRIGFCSNVRFHHLSGQSSPTTPRIEYLKNWHFGWSYSYFTAKHKISSNRNGIPKRYWTYRLKSWISIQARTRRQYQAKADGVLAFLQGKNSFLRDMQNTVPADNCQPPGNILSKKQTSLRE